MIGVCQRAKAKGPTEQVSATPLVLCWWMKVDCFCLNLLCEERGGDQGCGQRGGWTTPHNNANLVFSLRFSLSTYFCSSFFERFSFDDIQPDFSVGYCFPPVGIFFLFSFNFFWALFSFFFLLNVAIFLLKAHRE